MPKKRKAGISHAAVARAAVARKARMDKLNLLKKHKDHNEKETSDDENTNNSKDDVDNSFGNSCLDGDNSKTSENLSDIADDSQHSNDVSSECSNNTKIIKIVEIIDDENEDDENDNCFTTSTLDNKNNFIKCKKIINNLKFIDNNVESQSSENSMYELAELSSVHSNNDEENDLNNEKSIDNDDEDDDETTEYEVIVLEDDSENNNSQNCVEMEICVNDDETPIIKSIVTVDPNDHQTISIINKSEAKNMIMSIAPPNENQNDVEMEEDDEEEDKIIKIVEIKENDDFISNETVSTLQTSINDLNISDKIENTINKTIIENNEHNNENSKISLENNKKDDDNNSLIDNNCKSTNSNYNNIKSKEIQSPEKNKIFSKELSHAEDIAVPVDDKSFLTNKNEIVNKLISDKENEIKNVEDVSIIVSSLLSQTNGIVNEKTHNNENRNIEPIIIKSDIKTKNNSKQIHVNNHKVKVMDDDNDISKLKYSKDENNLKLKKQHQHYQTNDVVNDNTKSDVIKINHTNNNNLIINKSETESAASISPLLNGKNSNNDDDDDAPGIRRSSRIKIISESKQKSRGHGLVKDRERFLKKVNNSCDLQIPNNLDNSLLLLEASPSTVQATDLDKLQPVKVKSRWRRSSELEMRESIATKSLLSNGHQSNSNSSSCSSLNGIVKPQAELEKELQHQKDIEKRLSHFVTIKENCYHCDRNVSKEAKKMTCDCFLTKEEIGRGELGCGEDCLNRLLMIECSSRCIVGERCTNRRFQKNQYAQCNVFRTEKKGFGILANVEIHAGEFIMEYVGEVLNSKQFDRRANEYSKDKNKHYYFMALRSDAVIDATLKGNISRFINHSCDPNAETQKWTVNGELRIGFFSTRTILQGEEITFDYQYQRYGKEAQKCYCEAASCRGWIGEEPDSYDEEESDDEKKEQEGTKDKARSTVAKTSNDVDKNETDITESVSKVVKKKIKKKRPKMKRQEITDEPDLDEEITKLVKSGLKNQAHTLKFSRLIVRARLMDTRSRLLNILQNGDFPCRRLFLDYHGLRLLHGWMCDATIVESKEFYIFRLELLETLETLPIPNKTMLKDSKVIYSVEKWSTICCNDLNNKSSSSSKSSVNESRSETPPTSNSQTDGTLNTTNVDENKEKSKELLKNIPEILRQSNAIMEEIGLDKLKQIINNTGKLQQEKEKLQQEQKQIELLKTTSDENQQLKIKIYLLAMKLLKTWKILPEVFRIPKKERIEQMKEHEREADQQCTVSNEHVGEEKRSRYKDRYRDRERDQNKDKDRDTKDSRDKRLGGDQKDSWNTNNNNYNKTYEHYKKNLSKEQRRQLFEMKVAKEEAAKLKQEQWRLHEIKCLALRLDPHKITPENVPTVVNPATGQWYTYDRRPVATPPSHAHIKIPPKQMSTNPEDYDLPKLDLPPFWKYAIDPKGRIYYYHVKIRIPQWDPPIKIPPLIEEKVVEPEPEIVIDSDHSNHTDSSTTDTYDTSEEELERTLLKLKKRKKVKRKINKKIVKPKERQIDCENNEASKLLKNKLICNKILTSKQQEDSGTSDASTSVETTIKKHKKKKVRKEGLVTERIISPRREEDRLYNQREMKKYKATKEKLRKRKEEAKLKRKLPVVVPPVTETTTSNNSSSSCSSNCSTPKKLIKLTDGLPVVKDDEYLAALDIEKKIIHMNENKIMKPPPPIATVLPTPSVKTDEGTFRLPISRIVEDTEAMKKAKLLKKQQIMYEEWKRYQARMKHKMIDVRSDSKKHISRSPLRQTIMKGGKRIDIKGLNPFNFYNESRRIKDRFRNTIAAVVVQKLNPYRKSECLQGRITSNEDFKHLARKLTHFVMLKELKHCDNTVFALEVTESVKAKAREFIKKYMAKYGAIYIRADNEPDFRDFYLRI